jgi:dienelactone hydrolase
MIAAGEDERVAPPSALFTISDFERLVRGVELGFDGEATIHAWAASGQSWRLSQTPGGIELEYNGTPLEPQPHWTVLGKITLAKSQPTKIKFSEPPPAAATAGDKKAAAKGEVTKPPLAPLPALLWIAPSAQTSPPSLDLIRGRVDSTEPSTDLRRTRSRTNYQGAEFQAPATAEAWRDRARHVREQLRVTLGLWPEFPRTPLNARIVGKLDRDDYTIEKVVLETMPGFTLSGNLYRPASQCDRLPGILCPHGHWQDGRMNPEVQQRCIRWAKLGCVVFMYDMVGYNDSKPFTHKFLNDRLKRWGFSLPTLQTWNSLRALDWLGSLPDVDPARLACTGESGGGTQTFLLTAIDDRVKVAAPVVMVSDTFQGGCVCENAAGLRLGTDNVEFAALCAPRPMIMVGASGDWTAKTMSRAYPAIRGVYSLFGSMDRVTADVFDFPHNYNQTTRNAVYAFMGKWLLGMHDPGATKEGEQHTEKPEDLFTFNKDNPAPSERKTPEQLEAFLIDELSHQIEELSPRTSATQWEAARALLATSQKIRVGCESPAPENLTEREVRTVSREGFRIVHSIVGRRGAGDAIPVVRLIPAHPSGRVTVIADPAGKAGLANSAGEPSALADALIKSDQTVIGFDPLFVGESVDPSRPSFARPEVVHFDTYNPVVAADQIQDLATVVRWAQALADTRDVSLVGQGLSGLQVLLARPSLPGLARTAVDLSGLVDPLDPGKWPAAIDLPGMFQFGGFKAAAALTAPAPLFMYGAPAAFDTQWAVNAYASSDAAHLLRIAPRDPGPEELAEWIDRGE